MPQAPAKEINHDQDRSRTIWNPEKGLLYKIYIVFIILHEFKSQVYLLYTKLIWFGYFKLVW